MGLHPHRGDAKHTIEATQGTADCTGAPLTIGPADFTAAAAFDGDAPGDRGGGDTPGRD